MSRIHGLLICILLLTSAARAEDDFRSIVKAHSTAELLRNMQTREALSKDSSLCREQLRSHKVPYACFRLREVERVQLKNFSKSGRKNELDWLDLHCERTAERSTARRELLLALRSGARLPFKCRNAIQQRLDDLNYAAETENPTLLFDGRYD